MEIRSNIVKIGMILFLSFSVLYIIICYFYFWNNVPVNPDATYYLGSSRLIIEGKLLYKDFSLGYPPLSYYLICAPFLLFGDSFKVGLGCLYIITLINSFLLYLYAKKITRQNLISIFCSLYFLVCCCRYEGIYYVLEPFVLFFGLLSLLSIGNKSPKRLLFSGFFAFCAFWCKQYGLGFLFLILWNVYASTRRMKCVTQVCCGFISGAAFFIILLLLQGASFENLLSLSGSTYEKMGLVSLIGCSYGILKDFPTLIIGTIILVFHYKKIDKKVDIFTLYFAVLGFLLQCYVRNYLHYQILIIPFVILIIGYSISILKKECCKNAFFLLCSLCFLYNSYGVLKDMRYFSRTGACTNQLLYATEIKENIPIGSENVYISSTSIPVGYINNYEAPLLRKYGLSNGFIESKEGTFELIRNADWCIINDLDAQDKVRFDEEIFSYINSKFDYIGSAKSDNGYKTSIYRRIAEYGL